MGRKPIGKRPMTDAERQRRRRTKVRECLEKFEAFQAPEQVNDSLFHALRLAYVTGDLTEEQLDGLEKAARDYALAWCAEDPDFALAAVIQFFSDLKVLGDDERADSETD